MPCACHNNTSLHKSQFISLCCVILRSSIVNCWQMRRFYLTHCQTIQNVRHYISFLFVSKIPASPTWQEVKWQVEFPVLFLSTAEAFQTVSTVFSQCNVHEIQQTHLTFSKFRDTDKTDPILFTHLKDEVWYITVRDHKFWDRTLKKKNVNFRKKKFFVGNYDFLF